MKKQIFIFGILILCTLHVSLWAQKLTPHAQNILDKVQNVYAEDQIYSLDIDYNLYRGAEGKEILSSYSSEVARDHGNYYNRIKNTEFFYIGTQYLKVNHDQKRLQYGSVPENTPMGIDIGSYLAYFKKVTYQEIASSYLYTLSATDITPMPYGKIEIFIDKETLEIQKQVLYMLNRAPYKNKQGTISYEQPRLELIISPKREDIDKYKEKFDLSRYIKIKNNKAIGQGKIAEYEVIDTHR